MKNYTQVDSNDYIIAPNDTSGFYDIKQPDTSKNIHYLTSTEEAMAKFCCMVNVALQRAVYGDERGIKNSVEHNFYEILRNNFNFTNTCANIYECPDFEEPNWLFVKDYESFCADQRKSALNQLNTVKNNLRCWACNYINSDYLVNFESYNEDDWVYFASLFTAYVQFALDALEKAWFLDIAPFIAYPFYCDAFFFSLKKAEVDYTGVRDFLEVFRKWKLSSNIDNNAESDFELGETNPMPAYKIYHAINTDYDVKELVVVENGELCEYYVTKNKEENLVLEDFNDNSYAEEELEIDMSDIDLYL